MKQRILCYAYYLYPAALGCLKNSYVFRHNSAIVIYCVIYEKHQQPHMFMLNV
jgi:hypothetical protein